MLAWIYSIREAQLREAATAMLGFPEALEALRSLGDKAVHLGYAVSAEDPPYHFQLFLDVNLTAVVACLAMAPADS
ncbi:hypothetical protein [Actinoplanes couchii]|uniref:Uncharacterized protein n=1 Tax=Actinoplanes couchii TaxID=403638 RepID=A0ABQ3XDJ4_9ACTN|nr:hypothetical protein [Actinoplanes couchii]MDR6317044.1 hypothetical protein [Actinoplanes couchii]GID56540.1 hypothetical protein Aco03nite_049440 [Actinoplanes couchii]